MDEIKAAWNGKAPLVRVFWLYYFLGHLTLGALVGVTAAILETNGLSSGIIILATLIVLPYVVWSTWSVWACAFNVKWRPWGYMARAYVVFIIVDTTYEFVS